MIIVFGDYMKNYSRQREAILNALRATKSHPSASSVYEAVRKEIPNISLRTVYRNLAVLAENGDISAIPLNDGIDRFDGDTTPHIHLVCKRCSKITDLPIDDDFASKLATDTGFCPDSTVYVVYGVCKDCNRK